MVTQISEQKIRAFFSEAARLEAHEREISAYRRALHGEIDLLYLSSPLEPAETARLRQLEDIEADVSERRYRLHCEIDALRATVGLAPWPRRSSHRVRLTG
jgi:hypothetical protein